MSNHIPYYILMLLELEGQVRIPGLGILTRSVEPARIDQQASVILPPRAHSRMQVSDTAEGRLLEKFIAHHSGQPLQDVRDALHHFSSDLRTRTAEAGSATIASFGSFKRVEERVVFTPDTSAHNARYAGLKPVTVLQQPVTPSDVDEPRAKSLVTNGEPTPGAQAALAEPAIAARRRAVPLFVIVLIALMLVTAIFAYLQYQARQTALAEQARFNRSPVSEQVITARPQEAEEAPQDADTQVTQPSDPGQPAVPDTAVSEMDESEVETDTPLDSAQVMPDNVVEESVDHDCVIVVGAFGEQDNARRMLARLEQRSLEATSFARGTLTVVGVKAPCSGVALRDLLSQMRSEIEPGAWILNR
ncbi:MAG: hypothetical protein R3301_00050 [Saprospiraceae bacterium]|nr:hypothetical protein [Saprospiraceae bacterium]